MENGDARRAAVERLRAVVRQRSSGLQDPGGAGLDDTTRALVGVATALAVNSPPPTLRAGVQQAVTAGAVAEDVIATLVAVAPVIGLARVAATTPKIARAVGYDIDAALESTEDTTELRDITRAGGSN